MNTKSITKKAKRRASNDKARLQRPLDCKHLLESLEHLVAGCSVHCKERLPRLPAVPVEALERKLGTADAALDDDPVGPRAHELLLLQRGERRGRDRVGREGGLSVTVQLDARSLRATGESALLECVRDDRRRTGAMLAKPVMQPAAPTVSEGRRKSTKPPKTAKSSRRVVMRESLHGRVGQRDALPALDY